MDCGTLISPVSQINCAKHRHCWHNDSAVHMVPPVYQSWPILLCSLLLLLFAAIAAPLLLISNTPLNAAYQALAPGKFAAVPSGQVHYRLEGPASGALVVLVHGYSTPLFVWDEVAEKLHQQGYRTLAYDLYGRGFSERVPPPYGGALFQHQLLGLLQSLNISEPFVLVGYSMGGMIATQFTNDHPDRVDRLILIAPAGYPLAATESLGIRLLATPWIGDWMMHLMAEKLLMEDIDAAISSGKIPGEFGDAFVQQLSFSGTMRALRATLTDYMRALPGTDYARLGELKVPVGAIWGNLDTTVPYSLSMRMQQDIPRLKLCTLTNGGHGITFDQPEGVAVCLLSLMSSGSGSAPENMR